MSGTDMSQDNNQNSKPDELAQERARLSILQDRISAHQDALAEKERANQLKAQDLIQREHRLSENETILKREQSLFREQHKTRKQLQSKRSSLVAPILLIACVAAGYFAFENLDHQRTYFKQVKAASANVDKLARVLGITQQKMVKASSELEQKKLELEQAKELVMNLLGNSQNIEIDAQQTSRQQNLIQTLLIQSEAPSNYVEPQSKQAPKTSYEKLYTQLNEAGSTGTIGSAQQVDELHGIKRTLNENARQLSESIDVLAEREKLIESLKQNVATLSEELTSLKESYRVLQNESQDLDPLATTSKVENEPTKAQ